MATLFSFLFAFAGCLGFFCAFLAYLNHWLDDYFGTVDKWLRRAQFYLKASVVFGLIWFVLEFF